MEENLVFIEKCLKKYDYPNLYGSDLAEILGGPNRLFLLSWLYKLILDDKELSDEPSVEVLIDFINSYGFCSSSQTKQFIEMSLDYPVQIHIFYRMFKMLNTVKRKYEDSENLDELPLEVIDNFIKRDVNLFKSLGSLKVSDQVTESYLSSNSQNESMKFESEEHDEIKKLSCMEEKIDCASNIVNDLLRHTGTNNTLDLPIIETEIEDLKIFNESVTKAKEIIENIQTISMLGTGIVYDRIIVPDDNEYVRMAKEIIQMINEI